MRKSLFWLALLLAGCGDSGDGFAPLEPAPQPLESASPEILDLTMGPDSATHGEGNGSVDIQVIVSYSDADLDIETLMVSIVDGPSHTIPVGPFDTETGDFEEEFPVSTEVLGRFTIEFWLVDAAGNTSDRSRSEFLVEEPANTFPIHITKTIDGLPPNGPSVNGGLDGWGMYAIFASKASNLVAGDSNDAYDLFIREACARQIDGVDCSPRTTRGVIGTGGTEPNGDVGSTDTNPEDSLAVDFFGGFVAFVSSASNLVPDDTNGVDDVFLINSCIVYPWESGAGLCTPEITRVSLGNDGSQSTAPASHPAIALGGRYVVFVSSDPNLVAGDTNGMADVFLRDTCRGAEKGCTPSTMRISVADDGSQANGASGEPSFTGRYVAFSSFASNLVEGDSNGLRDVFLRDTCLGEPECDPSTQLVSVGRLGDSADGPSWDPLVTLGATDTEGINYHGRYVAFVSSATNLVAVDTNVASDVFRRDLCAGNPGCSPSTMLISMTSSGEQVQGDSWGPAFMSWEGGEIPFVTAADGVVPGDTNGMMDIYVWSGTIERMSVGANGAQTDGDSYAPRASVHPFGVGPVTYISEASNILPDVVVIPNNGNIYLGVNETD
jgi:hypothetical protein